jgi:hypothetical protein
VAALDRGDLESLLYQAQLQHNPERLGDNATKEFVLRHVFEIAPELIKQASDLPAPTHVLYCNLLISIAARQELVRQNISSFYNSLKI